MTAHGELLYIITNPTHCLDSSDPVIFLVKNAVDLSLYSAKFDSKSKSNLGLLRVVTAS